MNKNKAKIKSKFERGDVFSDQCPSRELLTHITSKWSVLIFLALCDGEILRFSDLRRKIKGISEKMLGQTLKNLEFDGFIVRRSYNVVPPVVDYQLSQEGMEVASRVITLTEWLEDNVTLLVSKRESVRST